MKNLIFLLLLFSCTKHDPEMPGDTRGCQYGIKSDDSHEFYKCSTYAQFKAGADTHNGGTDIFNHYASNGFDPGCDRCKMP